MSLTIERAERLFNAYNEQGPNPWKTFDGRDVPRWDGLNDQVRAKWVAVAVASAVADDEPLNVNELTARDWFAGQVLPWVAKNMEIGDLFSQAAADAYTLADAMLAARDVKR